MPTSGDSLRTLADALLETDAREHYPDRVVDPEQADLGELCREIGAAHQPGLIGECVSCHEPHPCWPYEEAVALTLKQVIVASNTLLWKWSGR